MIRLMITLSLCCLAGCDNPRQISDSGYGAFEPDIAALGDGRLAAAWHDNRRGNDEIYLRLLDEDLKPVAGERRLTDPGRVSYEADAAAFAGDVALAWYERDGDGRLAARVGLWNDRGTRLWAKTLSSPYADGRIPVIETAGDRLFVAWVEDPPEDEAADSPSILYGAWLNPRGGYLHDPFPLGHASLNTWNLNADAAGDGRIALVYDARFDTRASELYLAWVTQGRATVMSVSRDDGRASRYPDIALGGRRAALTWFDGKDGNNEVYLKVFDEDGGFAPVDAGARRVTRTGGDSIGAYLAWNGSSLGLAWNDDDSGRHEIYFQRFNAGGGALSPLRRITGTRADSLIPAITPWREGFVLAWSEVRQRPAGSAETAGHGPEEPDRRSEIFLRYVE